MMSTVLANKYGEWEIEAAVNGGRAYGWGATKAAAIAAALRVARELIDELEAAEYQAAFGDGKEGDK